MSVCFQSICLSTLLPSLHLFVFPTPPQHSTNTDLGKEGFGNTRGDAAVTWEPREMACHLLCSCETVTFSTPHSRINGVKAMAARKMVTQFIVYILII